MGAPRGPPAARPPRPAADRPRTPMLLALIALLPLSALAPAQGAPETPAELLEEVRRSRDSVEMAVFERLGRLRTPQALDALQQAVGLVRQPAPLEAGFRAFRHFRGEDGLQGQAIAFLVGSSESGFEPTRRAAARGLSLFGDAATTELRRLLDRSRDEQCRAFALGPLLPGFVQSATPADLGLVLDNLRVGPSGPRAALLTHLRAFAAPEHVAVFAARIADRRTPDPTKILAIEAIAERPDAAVSGALRAALRDRSEAVQLAALEALTERRDSVHEPELRRLLRAEDAAIRRLAIVSLGRIRVERDGWPRELLTLSQDRQPPVRMGAAAALAELRTVEALERLHAMLADPERVVRVEVLQAVGNLRRPQSVPHLIGRIEAERGRLREDVLTVLRLVTGLDHGTTRERWQRWWDAEGEAFLVPSYEEALAAEERRTQQREGGRTVTSFYGLRIVSDRVCFVLDVSGSMSRASGGRTRIEVAREELSRALERYPEGDLFNVVFFSTDVMTWQDYLVPMDARTRAGALDYVRRQQAAGYTAVYDALQRAFEDDRFDTLVLLTDGEPYRGTIDDPGEIRAAVRRWNSARHVRIHTVSVGTESGLLRNLARDTGGEYRSIRD